MVYDFPMGYAVVQTKETKAAVRAQESARRRGIKPVGRVTYRYNIKQRDGKLVHTNLTKRQKDAIVDEIYRQGNGVSYFEDIDVRGFFHDK